MKILAFFTSSGTPATGLTPTIRIRRLSDNTLVITDAVMSEVGDGHYQYNFAAYDKDIDYAIRCDGGIALNESDRYTYAGNENYIDDISETITETTSADFSTLNTGIEEVNDNVLGVSAQGDVTHNLLATIISNQQLVSGSEITELSTKIDSLSASNQANFDIVNQNIDEVNTNVLALSASIGEIQLSLEPVAFLAQSGQIVEGSNVSGDYTNTQSANDIYWITEASVLGDYDISLTFNLIDDYIPKTVFFQGHFDANPNDYLDTFAWNYVMQSWEKINTYSNRITSRNSDGDYEYALTLNHFEPSGGEVRIRFASGSTKIGDAWYLDYIGVISNQIVNTDVNYDLIAELTASEVWDEETKSHRSSGSFGKLIQDIKTTSDVISGGTLNTNTKIDSLSASNQANFDIVNQNIDEVNTNVLAVSGSLVVISNDIKKILGLVHSNIFIDNPVYDSYGNLTSARVRIYSNPASVGTLADVIGTYQISAPSTAAGQFTTWSQIEL